MESVRSILSTESERLFVGRQRELAMIDQWIQSKAAPTSAIFLSGMGGVGKTTLLVRAIDIARRSGCEAIWMDGRTSPETPSGFVNAILDDAAMRGWRPGSTDWSPIEKLNRWFSGRKTLLCIDDYDRLARIDSWLRESLLPELPASGLLLLFVSRQDVSDPWRKSLAWRGRTHHAELVPFTKHEQQVYALRAGIGRAPDLERLMTETQGLPLAMAVMTDRLAQGDRDVSVSLQIRAELLREVTAQELLEAVEILCLLPEASEELLNRLLRAPLRPDQWSLLFKISFVRPTSGGIALHDVARYHLLGDLEERNPERLRELRRNVIYALSLELKRCLPSNRWRINAILLALCRDAMQWESDTVIPSDLVYRRMEGFEPGDLPHLLEMLRAQAGIAVSLELDLALLAELSARFPDCIRVYRDDDGKPIAFFAGFYLYDETVRFHERFFPGLLRRAYPDEFDRFRTMGMAETDSYYQILGGAVTDHPEYSYKELVGFIIADGLMLRSHGMRAVIINKYTGLDELLVRIGYTIRPLQGMPEDHLFRDAAVRELDWRAMDLGDRMLELLGLRADEHDAKGNPLRAETDMRRVKAALPLVRNVRMLEGSELAAALQVNGEELQRRLRRLLSDPPVFPLDERLQRLLRLLSEKPNLSAELAAEQLFVSRATYFRLRALALQTAWEQLQSA